MAEIFLVDVARGVIYDPSDRPGGAGEDWARAGRLFIRRDSATGGGGIAEG